MIYAEKLKDPRWQKKRLRIMERDDFTCVKCGNEELELHVHHIKYFKGREPWEYSDRHLETLCHKCHKSEHTLPTNEDAVKPPPIAITSTDTLFRDSAPPKKKGGLSSIDLTKIKRLSLKGVKLPDTEAEHTFKKSILETLRDQHLGNVKNK